MIGSAGKSFDPPLERLIGQKVVVEIAEDGEVHEHVGVLKTYSPDFVTLLDVQYPQKQSHAIREGANGHARGLETSVADGALRVQNQGPQPVLVISLQAGDEEEMLKRRRRPRRDDRDLIWKIR